MKIVQKKLVYLGFLALSPGVFAVQLPSAALSGGQLQQIPTAPTAERAPAEIDIRVQQPHAPPADATGTAQIEVKALRLSGNTLYSEKELLALTDFTSGAQLNLGELQLIASRITDFYHQNGYFVAQAYLPAQEIHNGAVSIAVVEGHYGEVRVRNQSNLSDRLVDGLVDDLDNDQAISRLPLESRLLLLSDLPGVNIQSTLVPGTAVGEADLIVDVTPGQRVTGSIDADNAGNYYTGEYRLGGTINVNNLAGQGDVASLRVMSSFKGLNYARGAYQMQFGRATAGVAYSHLEYELGKSFEDLGVEGDAQVASVFARYPLLRTRQSNLYAQLGYDYRTFEDRFNFIPSVSEKNAHVVMATLHGDHSDGFGAGGLTAASVTWHTGELDIETAAVRQADALTAKSNGHYDKLNLNVMRSQQLTDIFSLYGSLSAQFASKNLDISEKMSLGGMYGVRAYPQGEAFADEGYLATVEARMLLKGLSRQVPGNVHILGFVDAGTVTVHKDPWDDADNRRTLSGTGVGFNWAEYNNFSVKSYYAHKLGNEAATSAPDSDSRFWIQLVKYF